MLGAGSLRGHGTLCYGKVKCSKPLCFFFVHGGSGSVSLRLFGPLERTQGLCGVASRLLSTQSKLYHFQAIGSRSRTRCVLICRKTDREL